MKLVSPKRIVVEDFPQEEQETISKLGFVINSVFEQIGQILTKNLTIADNLNEAIVPVQISVNSAGIPFLRTQFKYTLVGQCQGLQVISATNQTNLAVFPISQPFISFEQLPNGLINIKHVSGLQANNKYTLTVRVTGS